MVYNKKQTWLKPSLVWWLWSLTLYTYIAGWGIPDKGPLDVTLLCLGSNSCHSKVLFKVAIKINVVLLFS